MDQSACCYALWPRKNIYSLPATGIMKWKLNNIPTIGDYAKDGGLGKVWLLCSFYYESLCTWIKTIANKFAISNHTALILGMHALRSYFKLICEYELYSLPNKNVGGAKDYDINYIKVRPPLVCHLLRNRLLHCYRFCIVVSYIDALFPSKKWEIHGLRSKPDMHHASTLWCHSVIYYMSKMLFSNRIVMFHHRLIIWLSGYCYWNKRECGLNQSRDDSFVGRVAKNNS